MSKQKLPTVVVVGRTNVGKSTLFNRLSVDVRSLTLDQEGVTRDFLTDVVSWQGIQFELVDTGGISLHKTQDVLLEHTRQRALQMMEQATIIIFMCDGKAGVVPEDREISKMLHKMGKPVLLLINKVDTHEAQAALHEFDRLGHAMSIPISAQHGTGIADVLEKIVEQLAGKVEVGAEVAKPEYRVAIIGKPNVGKSSLLNLLTKKDRAIVADMPGTTREAISENVHFYKAMIQLTDTPGLRKKRNVTDELEQMMVKSAMAALRDADIVLFMVDGSEGRISDQELKLLFYAFQEHNKAVIFLVNKQDLMNEYAQETLDFSLDKYDFFVDKVARLDISCKTEKNVGKILSTIEKVWQRHSQTFNDDDLTILFKEALIKKPLYRRSLMLTVSNAKQIRSAPITIVLRTNLPEFFGPSQLAFLERIMRKKYDLKGVPINFLARKK